MSTVPERTVQVIAGLITIYLFFAQIDSNGVTLVSLEWVEISQLALRLPIFFVVELLLGFGFASAVAWSVSADRVRLFWLLLFVLMSAWATLVNVRVLLVDPVQINQQLSWYAGAGWLSSVVGLAVTWVKSKERAGIPRALVATTLQCFFYWLLWRVLLGELQGERQVGASVDGIWGLCFLFCAAPVGVCFIVARLGLWSPPPSWRIEWRPGRR